MAVSLREVVSFGRYEPLFRIAAGGMAEVYAARIQGEAGFQKLVAVKRMHPHMATDQSFVDMFLNEARLAAHISSPNVVQTMDLGRGSDGSLYIVMELVVGLSLSTLADTKGAPLPVPIVLALMAQAAQGLDDAHEATTPAGDELGLVHRDISPHNILVGLDGRARLTDFGIARAIHAPRSETNVKELKGKFAYMSPEQTRLKSLDHRSDVFSLGVVIWELLVGDKLFYEVDAAQTIKNVRRRKIAPPHERVPSVPEEVSAIVMKSLERLPTKRYQSAAVFADALRRAGTQMGGLPSRKRVASFVKETGGDELERLQRLIRLGTEGAEVEAFEKVRPGSTQVLGTADASGISRIGGPELTPTPGAPPKVITVTLPEDDEAFDDEDEYEEIGDEEIPTAALPALRLDAMEENAPVDPTVPPVLETETNEYVKVAVDPIAIPSAPAPAPTKPARAGWLVAGVAGGVLLVGAGGLLAWTLASTEPETAVTLPEGVGSPRVEEPEPEAEAEADPEPETGAEAEAGAETGAEAEAEAEAGAEAEAEAGAEAGAEAEAGAGAEGDTGSEATPRRRRRRRRGQRRRGEGPLLLDVDQFDQHSR